MLWALASAIGRGRSGVCPRDSAMALWSFCKQVSNVRSYRTPLKHQSKPYPSMSELDVEKTSGKVISFVQYMHDTVSYRSDSVMSSKVSQVSKPSAANASVYCDSPRRASRGLKSVM